MGLTWCHCTPLDAPASPCTSITIVVAISPKLDVDKVTLTFDGGRQGGADVLAANDVDATARVDAISGRSTALPHQGCPVAVCDCQVVMRT